MSLFDWLLVGHLVGDFLLQSDVMVLSKAQSWAWLLGHVGIYSGILAVVLTLYAVPHHVPAWAVVLAICFLFGTHVVLDRRQAVTWWMRHTGMEPNRGWLLIVVDQVFHVLVLTIVAQALSMVQP